MKRIKRLNTILASELGRAPNGTGIYQWAWSENERHPMRETDRDGRPLYDYVCGCGKNVSVHKPDCKSLSVPVPRIKVRPLAPWLHCQWMLAMWSAPPSQEEWAQAFGTSLEYPANGYLSPTNVALPKGQEPTDDVTWELIRNIRFERSKTITERIQEETDAVDRKERAAENKLDDQLADMMTAFGNIPGKRSTGISLPTQESRENHDAALSAA